MTPLQISIPHHELLTCSNALLLLCDHVQQAVPEFLIPAVCAAEGADPRLIELQFANMRINLEKAGITMLSWFHVPDGDAQILLFFGCD
jgi:hypothetical protein